MPAPTHRPIRAICGGALVGLWVLSATASAATLDAYLAGAVAHDPELAAAEARTDRARAEVVIARARLLPRLHASGAYTRNQYAAEIDVPDTDDVVTIQAIDQLDARVRLDVPIVDAAGIAGTTSAARCARAADAREGSSRQAVLLDVVRDVHDTLAAVEVVRAAEASLAASEAVHTRAVERRAQGAGSELDVLRGQADVARAREELARAEGQLATLRRRLEARTGVAELPEPSPSRPLPEVVDPAADHPDLRGAASELDCRKAGLAEARWGYAPTVAGFAEERLTNATSFVGQPASWAVGVQASWALVDGGAREGRMAAAAAARREAEAAHRETARAVVDAVADARDQLGASEGALAAARARRAASAEALRVVRERHEAGLSSTVEVSLALRDDFEAAVGEARAAAERATAVEALRAALGLPLHGGAS